MSEKTCKNCRWWKADDGETADASAPEDEGFQWLPIPLKPCRCPKVVDMSAPGEAQRGGGPITPTWFSIPLDAVGYSDREGFHADIRTGPDFSCLHFEDKPNV